MGFNNYFVGLAATAIFVFAIVTFGIQFGVDNDTSISLSDDPSINEFAGNVSQELDTSRSDQDAAEDAFEAGTKDQIELTGDIGIPAVTSLRTLFVAAPLGIINLITDLIFTNIFGESGEGFGIVLGMVLAVVFSLGLLLFYKVIKTGDSE